MTRQFVAAIGLLLSAWVAASLAQDPAVRTLVEAAADPAASTDSRMAAIAALRARGQSVVPELARLLGDADPNVRIGAANALGQPDMVEMLDDAAVTALTVALEHDSVVAVKMNAALALGGAHSA